VVVVVVAGVWSAAGQLMLGWTEFVQQWELQFPAWPPAYSQQLQEVLGTYTASLMGAAMAAARADADEFMRSTCCACAYACACACACAVVRVRVRVRGEQTFQDRGS
jgi:alkylation response protein AidB-like acyl-CoA dehydrogenase